MLRISFLKCSSASLGKLSNNPFSIALFHASESDLPSPYNSVVVVVVNVCASAGKGALAVILT